MLLSAVSVLVVAQSSSEIPEGLMNNPVYIAVGRIKSMKNSNDNIVNRTHDHPACSAVPQPTAPPRVVRA